LSGLDVPMLIVTNKAMEEDYYPINSKDFTEEENKMFLKEN
jgi:hypothetical protein